MKHLKLLLTLFMGALCSADLMADVVTWTSGDVTATLDGNTLTISGQGAMADFLDEGDFSLWREGSYKYTINEVIIEDGVTRIGNYAFADCWYLSSITIPSSVTSIGEYAFYNCKTLTSIEFPEGGTSSLTSIGESAFYNCEALASVTIPECVTSMERHTFYGCKNLASISIPETVTSIGEYAFYNCEALASVTIPEGVTLIQGYAFEFLEDIRSFPVIYCWADPEKLNLGEEAVDCQDFYVNAKYQVKYMDIPFQNLKAGRLIGFLNEEEDYSELLGNSILDDNDLVCVALGRTFISGYYYTFSFPFDIEFYDLNRVFESNCVVKKLASSKIDNDNILTMTFEDLWDFDYIEANKPYLIKVSSDVVNPVLEFYKITGRNNYNPSTSCVDFVSSSKGKTLVSGYGGSDDEMSVLFLGANNTLYNPMVVNKPDDPNSYIKGFRGYFQVHPEVQQNIRAYRMNFGDEESTGIQMLNVDEEISGVATGIYTLDGRCLNDMPTEKGLYIVNGKKIMIK